MIIGAATGFVGIVHRVPLRRWLPPASVIVAGTLLSAFLWKVYLNRHLAIPDQFVVRALPDWSFELWDELLLAMLRILKTHTLYSTLVIATLTVGVASLVRRNLIANPTLRLMVGLVCVVMGLHVASLFAAYLGTGFEDWMITTASSFPRYTTQVGYAVCVTGLLMATTVLVPAVSAKLASVPPRRLAMASVLVCVVLFSAMTVRQTLALQDLVRERAHHREVALAALKNVPAGHRVVAAAPKWTLNYLRYVAWAELGPGERPSLVDGLMFYKSDDDCEANRVLANWMANPSIDAVLLVDADAYVKRCARNSSPDRIWWRLAGSWRSIQVPEDRG
jgi:FtsH-binding integral membrane protein